MARVNVSMPDDLYRRARQAHLNVSRIAQGAVARELERMEKVVALDAYLAELDAELGSLTPAELAAADEWADRVLGPPGHHHSA